LSAEPAAFPGAMAARTMFAALFGELVLDRRLDTEGEASHDAYSLFYARSSAMRWLTPAVQGASGGLWGMNDAEAVPDSGPRRSRVAFFQVVLTEPNLRKLLPVQPFLTCAGDVMARLGTLRLEAVQVLLPERDADEDAQIASPSGARVASSLLDACHWFAGCDLRARTGVRVTLDAGPDPSIRTRASAILQWAREVRQEVFAGDSLSLADDDHLILRPIPFQTAPAGPHRVTFRGILAEWSLDALGWLAAFLADGASRHGISSQLMFTADRTANTQLAK
jgi:hypothetical protein